MQKLNIYFLMTFYFMHYFNIKYNLYTISNYPKEDGELAKTNLVIRLTILSRLNNLVIIKTPKLTQLQGSKKDGFFMLYSFLEAVNLINDPLKAFHLSITGKAKESGKLSFWSILDFYP